MILRCLKQYKNDKNQTITANKLKQGFCAFKIGKYQILRPVLRANFGGKTPCLRLFANRYKKYYIYCGKLNELNFIEKEQKFYKSDICTIAFVPAVNRTQLELGKT